MITGMDPNRFAISYVQLSFVSAYESAWTSLESSLKIFSICDKNDAVIERRSQPIECVRRTVRLLKCTHVIFGNNLHRGTLQADTHTHTQRHIHVGGVRHVNNIVYRFYSLVIVNEICMNSVVRG